jgi:hypothetical protein
MMARQRYSPIPCLGASVAGRRCISNRLADLSLVGVCYLLVGVLAQMNGLKKAHMVARSVPDIKC